MFNEALNAPWLLIILYAIPLVSSWLLIAFWGTRDTWKPWQLSAVVLAAGLLGAGLALLGAAYLHDVWYC